MYSTELEELLHAAPFEPFTLHMAKGRKISIGHPELAMFTVNKRSLVVALPNGGVAILDLRLATHTETEERPARGRKR